MKPSQRELAAKADIAVANLVASGGYLNVEQSDRFIRMLKDEPTILRALRVVEMNSPQKKIERIGFGSRVLHASPGSGVALTEAERSRPITGMIQLNTKEMIAEVHIPYDVLEDNIERGGLEDTIMADLVAQVSMDLEELLILGSLASADLYLAQLNGVIAQCVTHIVNVAGPGSAMSKSILKAAIKAMPTKYLRNLPAWRYWVSHNNEIEYRDTVADRETALGDLALEGVKAAFAYGVPVVPAALMPEVNLVMTHPKNLVFGIQRQIMIETDKDIRERVYIVVVTLRADFIIEEEDAVVLVTGINLP